MDAWMIRQTVLIGAAIALAGVIGVVILTALVGAALWAAPTILKFVR